MTPSGGGDAMRLTLAEQLPVLLGMGVLAAVCIPRLPPGICYGDSGDLQVASATLGIAHPPGYAVLVSLGYVLTRVPFVDPAYMVSLGCCAAGIITLGLAMLASIRLGLNAFVAVSIGVAMTSVPRVWENLLAPEVYAPTLAALAGAAYLTLRYAQLYCTRHLLLAALMLGIAIAIRSPTALALPFFGVAWWWSMRRREANRSVVLRRMTCALALLLLPYVYTIGFLWVRDQPHTPLNYIEQYNAEVRVVPCADAGPAAKLARVTWLLSGAQYRNLMGNNWHGVRSKLRWLAEDIAPQGWPVLLVGGAIVLVGGVLIARRCGPMAWVLLGMAVQSVVFVCAYRIYGQAADLLPLLWVLMVAGGVALSWVFPRNAPGLGKQAAPIVLLAACGWTLLDSGNRPNVARDADATGFVRGVDLSTFPRDAVICSSWGTSPPLWYAQHVLADRPDLTILNARSENWVRMIAQYPGPEVYYTDAQAPRPPGYELAPYRKLWRLVPATQATSQPGEAHR